MCAALVERPKVVPESWHKWWAGLAAGEIGQHLSRQRRTDHEMAQSRCATFALPRTLAVPKHRRRRPLLLCRRHSRRLIGQTHRKRQRFWSGAVVVMVVVVVVRSAPLAKQWHRAARHKEQPNIEPGPLLQPAAAAAAAASLPSVLVRRAATQSRM